ncbi:MAG: acetyl-CoA C-acyltransferase [Methylacidiphilales bacterium]|nr:acetyl-CoA C-acyltransferase [Candidatus Methylacidiphilales bacterium]
MKKVFIIDTIRTAVGKRNGVFSRTRPDDLLVHCLRALVQRNNSVDWERVGDHIAGCAMPEAEQGLNVARSAVLLAGLPQAISGMTVNRFCASGLQAVSLAADKIMLGNEDLMIASGVESMSQVPMGGNKPSFNQKVFTNQDAVGIAWGMGSTAEEVSVRFSVTRQEQDAFAFESHRRAINAQEKGYFTDEIIPFTVERHSVVDNKLQTNTQQVLKDEGPRADSTLEALAKLKPVFAGQGSVTAGNSSQMSDGAGAVLLASEEAVKAYQLTPKAIFHGYTVAGLDPKIMGVGPIKAIPKLLDQVKISLDAIDWIELNEAFAAQSLAVIKELKLDQAKVNPQGGAIALGHPLGATGAIRTATIVSALRRNKLRFGIVSMCIGTGMGAAGLFESCS